MSEYFSQSLCKECLSKANANFLKCDFIFIKQSLRRTFCFILFLKDCCLVHSLRRLFGKTVRHDDRKKKK